MIAMMISKNLQFVIACLIALALMMASLLLNGCSDVAKADDPQNVLDQYTFLCEPNIAETSAGYVERCENTEVICYFIKTGISCMKKGN